MCVCVPVSVAVGVCECAGVGGRPAVGWRVGVGVFRCGSGCGRGCVFVGMAVGMGVGASQRGSGLGCVGRVWMCGHGWRACCVSCVRSVFLPMFSSLFLVFFPQKWQFLVFVSSFEICFFYSFFWGWRGVVFSFTSFFFKVFFSKKYFIVFFSFLVFEFFFCSTVFLVFEFFFSVFFLRFYSLFLVSKGVTLF